VAEAVEFSLMNVVLWLLVLVGGASLGFAALLVRLVIWSLTR
jgi:hypothetical protein